MNLDDKYTSYNVTYSNEQIGAVVALLENALIGIDRDLTIVSLICLALCRSDPDLIKDEVRFRYAVEAMCDHMVWVIGSPAPSQQEMN